MTRDKICAMLPETPRKGMMEACLAANLQDELGGELILYSRERYEDYEEPIMRTMTAEDWERRERSRRRTWAALCTCTACQEDYYLGWVEGGHVDCYQGEDGIIYDGVPRKGDEGILQVQEDDEIVCPVCGTYGKLTRRVKLKSGRTKQVAVNTVENVGKLTAVVTWIVSRRFDEYGYAATEARPRGAAVIRENGKLWFFTHERYGPYGQQAARPQWEPQHSGSDFQQKKYYDWGSISNRKIGCWTWSDVPEQLGQTGEKTGLADYMSAGGVWPILYLRFWQSHPAVENIVKAGWFRIVESELDEAVWSARGYGGEVRKIEPEWGDWCAKKPSEILWMSKEEIRNGPAWGWGAREIALWWETVCYGNATRGDASVFAGYLKDYGYEQLYSFMGDVTDGWYELELWKIDRYLRRQQKKHMLPLRQSLGMYVDYRKMLDRATNGAKTTEIEKWPPDLRAAHDRLAAAVEAEADLKWKKAFRETAEKWKHIEWTDGELCAILPRENSELTREGKTLQHCVGGYGEKHCSGKLIVFIRHYRRPERSYFTLNVDVTGKLPREIQLHGYGNEWAHDKRLTIPKKVRDFCDRWEREVLLPEFMAQKAAEKKSRKKARKTA